MQCGCLYIVFRVVKGGEQDDSSLARQRGNSN